MNTQRDTDRASVEVTVEAVEEDETRNLVARVIARDDTGSASIVNVAGRTFVHGSMLDSMNTEKLELANHIDGCVRAAADALRRAEAAEAQLATKEQYLSEWKALADKLENGHRRMIIRMGEAEAQLATARKALEEIKAVLHGPHYQGDPSSIMVIGVAWGLANAALNSGEQK